MVLGKLKFTNPSDSEDRLDSLVRTRPPLVAALASAMQPRSTGAWRSSTSAAGRKREGRVW